MQYVLISLIKANENQLDLLVPLDIDSQIITQSADDLFALRQLINTALSDLMTDYDQAINATKAKLNHLKPLGVIGYPLDARDPTQYALDKGLDFETLTLEI